MLLLGGCSEKESVSLHTTQASDLPIDLSKMQGCWKSQQEGRPVNAVIEGYTVRLTYEQEIDGLRCKRNVSIREVVSSQGQLEVYGDQEPWFYIFHKQGETQELDLRFFDASRHEWINLHLQQEAKANRIAGL